MPIINNIISIRNTVMKTNKISPRTLIEISKAAFDHNIAYYKNIIGAHNTLAAVIKSNGYGHGLHQIASLCQQNSLVDWLCVAYLSEALALKNITKPILVLGYSDCSIENAVGKNIHFMVDNFEYAQKLNAIGKKYNYQFNVHIKIDTGLSRMGVSPDNALALIRQLETLDNIILNGIFSHFAASDNNPEYTNYQFQQFNDLLASLKSHHIHLKYVHMSNSAAISTLSYPAQFNFFRLGLGAYGFGTQAFHLKPVLTWKTHIVNIKTVPAHSFISYACTYKTTKTTRIALLPVGYADGYDFRFSNKTSVLINDFYAPVLGRVAMNMTIIDITDIPASIDDEVIMVGNFSDINAQNLATIASIPNVREFFTGINGALTRIIVK